MRWSPAAWRQAWSGWPRWSADRLPYLLGSAGIAAVLGAAGLHVWHARSVELDRTHAAAQNMVELLHEETRAAFLGADVMLRSIRDRLASAPAVAPNDRRFRAFMQASRAEAPYVRALFVVGPDGFVLHDTDYPETPRVSLADRSYFATLRDDPERVIFVGEPLVSRSLGRWFVPLARRLGEPGGAFAGVAVAAIEPRFFERVFQNLRLGRNDSVALFHAEGRLIAREPLLPSLIGSRQSHLPLFTERLPAAPRGVFETSTFLGRPGIVAYRQVDGFPLVATVMLDRTDALAHWRRQALLVGLAAGLIVALVLLLVVLTARRRRDRQIAVERAMAAQKLEAVGEMAAGIAHDFNNVLGAIASGIRLIGRQGPKPVLMAELQHGVERGVRLTRGLMAFAKTGDSARESVDPNTLIGDLELFVRQAAGHGVTVAFDLAPDVGACLISRAQFEASLMNIVLNAVQAMPAGGRLRIETSRRVIVQDQRLPSGTYACIRVTDTGCGIAPENLPHVLEPFFTTKSESGTGLGLAQVRRFVSEAGGEVRIGSQPGAGTAVELLLPCIGESQGAVPAEEQRLAP